MNRIQARHWLVGASVFVAIGYLLSTIGAKPDGVESLGDFTLLDGDHAMLGMVAEAQITKATFRIRNDTKSLVRFDPAVATSCGCSSAELDQTSLKSGETAVLTIAASTNNRQYGARRIGATVRVLEPTQLSVRTLKFELTLYVSASWQVMPAPINVLAYPGEFKSFEFRVLRGSANAALAARSVLSSLPSGQCEVLPGEIDLVDAFRVRTSFVAPLDVGLHRYSISIDTDDAIVPQRQLPVLVRIVPKWRISPPRVVLSQLSKGALFGRTRLIGPSSNPLVHVDGGDAGYEVAVGPGSSIDGSSMAMVVELKTASGEDIALGKVQSLEVVVSEPAGEFRIPIEIHWPLSQPPSQ